MLHRRKLSRLLITAAGLLLVCIQALSAQDLDSSRQVPRVLTNIWEIWTVPAVPGSPRQIKTEALIYFYSSEWSCAWGECHGRPIWLPIFDSHLPLQAGQRVAIEGELLPGRDQFDWSKSRIQVLEEGVELKPETMASLGKNPKRWDAHVVEVEGLILGKAEDTKRLVLTLKTLDVTATVRAIKLKNLPASPLKPGDRVRVKAVFAPNFDQHGSPSEFNLWTARTEDIQLLPSAGSASPPIRENLQVLTNIYQIWTMPLELKQQPHRMRTEMVIYFFDPEWNSAWGECQGEPAYLPIADCPMSLKSGQRIALDGVVVPIRERFIWNETSVRVLEENVELKAETLLDASLVSPRLKGHLLSVEGLVDRVLEDPTHLTIRLLVRDAVANAYLVKSKTGPASTFQSGDFVRIKCVCSPQFDQNGVISDLSLYIGRPEDIEVIGTLQTDPRFDMAATPSQDIREETPTNDLLRVEGVVRSHEQGKWVTIWDDTGQVMVESKQAQPLRVGDQIEAIGHPYIAGVKQCLRGGLYRAASRTNQAAPLLRASTLSQLCLAERIRDLSPEEASQPLQVKLRALVTWSHEETPFAYVQDASGGIRLVKPKWEEEEARKAGTIVTVTGEVCPGDFVPVITNATISRVGFWNLEEGRLVSLEQALTGVEDGRWIQMRGFVRQVSQLNGLARFSLTTSSGEFEVWTPATQSFESWQGSIIRVQGVCAAVSNARRQLTGIQIWAPEVKYIQIEEPAPNDLFAVPFRSLGSLRCFNAQNALNQRVRTIGTVVLHVPGSYVYVQEGIDSVLARSTQPEVLQPGDRVEVVGFPGNEGRRFLLREAVFRRLSTGPQPIPVPLSASHSVNSELEGVLAKAEGVLLNTVVKEGEVRLLIRTPESAFEASLNSTAFDRADKTGVWELGSRLAICGVYQVQNDDYANPRSFLLRLRSTGDVTILQQPPWWTLARLLWLLAAVLAVSLLVLYWGIVSSRRNALLRQAQAELQAAHNKLELRVDERTRELQERTKQLQAEVIAKDRAREELAEAQRHLMQSSRQAGMAEVATGVLHNVGNVLNSVNISVAMVKDKVTQSCNVNLDKVLALLHQNENDLSRFFASDPRGKKLIDYLELLNRHLGAEKGQVLEELQTLTQNVEHIKEIVAMQQSYAQASGVLEILEATDLIEDAIRMHSAAYQRHAVRLVREFASVPPLTVDRHKTLQILTNLLHNAKYACEEKGPGERKVMVRLHPLQSDRIRIEVADNGVGIPPENLTRIFSFGFTTRRNGHGFGLHSGALAAREMGGSLSAFSDGLGKGATFALELPVNHLVASGQAV